MSQRLRDIQPQKHPRLHYKQGNGGGVLAVCGNTHGSILIKKSGGTKGLYANVNVSIGSRDHKWVMAAKSVRLTQTEYLKSEEEVHKMLYLKAAQVLCDELDLYMENAGISTAQHNIDIIQELLL